MIASVIWTTRLHLKSIIIIINIILFSIFVQEDSEYTTQWLVQCFSTFSRHGLFSDQYKSSRAHDRLRLRQ